MPNKRGQFLVGFVSTDCVLIWHLNLLTGENCLCDPNNRIPIMSFEGLSIQTKSADVSKRICFVKNFIYTHIHTPKFWMGVSRFFFRFCFCWSTRHQMPLVLFYAQKSSCSRTCASYPKKNAQCVVFGLRAYLVRRFRIPSHRCVVCMRISVFVVRLTSSNRCTSTKGCHLSL